MKNLLLFILFISCHWSWSQNLEPQGQIIRTGFSLNLQADHEIKILPIKVVKGLILIAGKVGTKEGYFVIDSGAPALIINEIEHLKDSSQAIQASSCQGKLLLDKKRYESIVWGATNYKNREAYTLDLSHLQLYTGQPILGLLGYEVLKEQVIGFNLVKSKLYLAKRVKSFTLIEPPDVTVSMKLIDHLPVIPIEMNSEILNFVFDTGAAENLIHRAIVYDLPNITDTLHQIELQGLDQSTQVLSFIEIHSFFFSTLLFKKGTFLPIDLQHLQEFANYQVHGVMGSVLFKDMVFALDYDNRQISVWK